MAMQDKFDDGSIPEDYPNIEDDVDFEEEEDEEEDEPEPLDDYGSFGQPI